MYLAKNLSTDPYFNMAAEEYFLDHFQGELIFLWRNHKTVVVGKNQNTAEEVDADYVAKNHIAVVRRLTGGGAVFHDLGNINYTVIQRYKEDLFSNYAYFTKPVCGYLKALGINAELSGRNDLLIDHMKFCGNAQTKRGDHFMHHGCILFTADVADLSGSLTPSKLKIQSKSVKSVRSRVTNVSSHLKPPMSSEEFFDGLYQYFLENTEGIQEYHLTESDKAAIEKLAKEKYETWEWNYGKSPKFSAGSCKRFAFGIVDLRFSVENGCLQNVQFFGDFFGIKEVELLAERLQDCAYEQAAVDAVLSGEALDDYISGITAPELVELFFGS